MVAGRRGRKPDPEVDAAIQSAVLELVSDKGLEVTYDEVAARAQVGRASVFRRYPTKRDMLLDAVGRIGVGRVPPPDTGTLYDDLVALLTQIGQVFGKPPHYGLARQVLAEAPRDPQFTFILRELNGRRQGVVDAILDQAVRRGEVNVGVPRKIVGDMLTGYYCGLLSAGTEFPNGDEINRIASLVAHGLKAAEPASS
ncbi:MAG: TetR/AcrR family transcriptional regulator [Streptomycetaceae bacterium]|nr:TetR/AcrR family transcriptional regulator [Streptomycetaceae bacterium]